MARRKKISTLDRAAARINLFSEPTRLSDANNFKQPARNQRDNLSTCFKGQSFDIFKKTKLGNRFENRTDTTTPTSTSLPPNIFLSAPLNLLLSAMILIQQVLRFREAWVATLEKTHRDRILSILQARGLTRDEAEDIWQETVIRAVEHLFWKGENPEENCGWLIRVSLNLAWNRFRYLSRDRAKNEKAFLLGFIPNQEADPDCLSPHELGAEHLWDALDQIDPKNVDILFALHDEEMTESKVAKIFNLKKAEIIKRNEMALKKLRSIITEKD